MSCIFVLNAIISFLICSVNGQVYSCNEPYECTGNEIGVFLDCRGYSSCKDANKIIAANVECVGSNSCFNVSKVLVSTTNLECSGYQSCSNSPIFGVTQSTTFCYSRQSCVNSIFSTNSDYYNHTTHNDKDHTLKCFASASCAQAIITGIHSIYGYGLLSMYKSEIYSGGNETNVTVELTGHYAGYQMTVFCEQHDRCIINCYDTGCYQTYVYCHNESNLCVINCNSTTDAFCPMLLTLQPSNTTAVESAYTYTYTYDVYTTSSTYTNVSMTMTQSLLDIMMLDNIEDNECNLNNLSINCVNSFDEQCYQLNYTLINNNASICCRSYRSCLNSNAISDGNISIHTTAHFKVTNNDSSIFCGAYASCGDGDGDYQVSFESNYNIYCYAIGACPDAILSAANMVLCDAVSACWRAEIYNSNQLYCNGYASCDNTIISNVSNIYLNAYQSAINSIIHSNGSGGDANNNMNVYMESYLSGQDIMIHCDLGDKCNIYCNTTYSCSSKDGTVGATLICKGSCVVFCNYTNNLFTSPVLCPINMTGNYTIKDPSDYQIESLITSSTLSTYNGNYTFLL